MTKLKKLNSRKWLTFGALILVFVACNQIEEQDMGKKAYDLEATRNTIAEAMKAQEAAWNAGDISGFMNFYKNDDEIRFVSERGVDKGYETILKRYQKSYPDTETMGKLKFEILEFVPAGDSNAMVIGSWTLFRENDQPGGYFSLLWEKTPEGWKIINDHTS